mgnify:CR=1 FL=1
MVDLRYFRIEDAATGRIYGDWLATHSDAALESCLRDWGYESPEAALADLHLASWSDLRRELRIYPVDPRGDQRRRWGHV